MRVVDYRSAPPSAISLRRGCHRDKRLGLGNMFKMGATGVVEALRDAACDAFQEVIDLGEGAAGCCCWQQPVPTPGVPASAQRR